MRIIAGRFRGRSLAVPKSRALRPTADRVREAVFSILGGRVVGSRVLDLFAGTGALGLEALSRGAACAVFVDYHRSSVALIRSNLERCQVKPSEAHLMCLTVPSAVARLETQGRRFDLIFMDPPYGHGWVGKTLALLDPIAAPEALIIAEHHVKDDIPEVLPPWHVIDQRSYGTVCVTFYGRRIDPPLA